MQLGMVADVIGQVSQHSCSIGIYEDDGAQFEWGFWGERNDMSMRVKRVRGELATGDEWDEENPDTL